MASDPSSNLPYLPGYTFEKKKENYGKTQFFSKQAGLSFVKTDGAPKPTQSINIPRATADMIVDKDKKTRKPISAEPEKLPAWVAYDRKVLRFYGFFKETVTNSATETFRVRKCIFYYYLEDDSMHIAEPRQQNSGLPQGVFVKRHRVQKPDGVGFYTAEDLKVGINVTVYGRVFRLYDCDEFTRKFYKENGADQPPAEECPEDSFDKLSKTQKKKLKDDPLKEYFDAQMGKKSDRGTRTFLENDRKVLRFFCRWDDLSMYGETMVYVLHFFLSDGTVEVLQVKENNSGRDHFPALLKRQKLPKSLHDVAPSINKIGAVGKDADFYEPKDIICGDTINVYNREIKVCACDKFTHEWYKSNLNITQQPDLPIEEETKMTRKEMKPPPHNGFGSEEDSLGSFLFLVPKVPKKDYKKFNENAHNDLRFLAKFKNPSVQDMDRRFIITFHVADNKISVHEKNERNSGFIGGKFLQRSKLKNSATGTWYEANDLHLGAEVEINKYKFKLVKADEFTLKFMEGDAGQFPCADINRIMKQLQQMFSSKSGNIRDVFRQLDFDKNGTLSYDEFKKFLFEAGFKLNEHEILTVCRAYDADGNGEINLVEFARRVHGSDSRGE
mmetsp:Transcript_779/g.1161  ORF Transcript_779/g.1161 Transcript_779/m.1161 type:complete len:613 (-) Transcript_779:318-2156(-)